MNDLERRIRALEAAEAERGGVVKAVRIIGLLLGIAVSLLALLQVTDIRR